MQLVSDTKVNLGVVKVANQFLQWQGSLYWGRISIGAVLHKCCIAHIAHTGFCRILATLH